VNNVENNEIAKQCNPDGHKFRSNEIPPLPKAWHGLKIDIEIAYQEDSDDEHKEMVRIQTSFSDE
jgi:hypothetical protein